jgi:hypothetical protein
MGNFSNIDSGAGVFELALYHRRLLLYKNDTTVAAKGDTSTHLSLPHSTPRADTTGPRADTIALGQTNHLAYMLYVYSNLANQDYLLVCITLVPSRR